MGIGKYIDNDAAAQATEELRDLTIGKYPRDRSPQLLVPVSNGALSISLRAYLNQSGKYTEVFARC